MQIIKQFHESIIQRITIDSQETIIADAKRFLQSYLANNFDQFQRDLADVSDDGAKFTKFKEILDSVFALAAMQKPDEVKQLIAQVADRPNIKIFTIIQELIATEKELSSRSKEVARILKENQAKLASYINPDFPNVIKDAIQSYDIVSKNIFEADGSNINDTANLPLFISRLNIRYATEAPLIDRICNIAKITINFTEVQRIVNAFIEQSTTLPSADRRSLQHHLIAPVQRLSRILLLIQQALKTLKDNPGFKARYPRLEGDLYSLQRKMLRVCASINQLQKVEEAINNSKNKGILVKLFDLFDTTFKVDANVSEYIDTTLKKCVSQSIVVSEQGSSSAQAKNELENSFLGEMSKDLQAVGNQNPLLNNTEQDIFYSGLQRVQQDIEKSITAEDERIAAEEARKLEELRKKAEEEARKQAEEEARIKAAAAQRQKEQEDRARKEAEERARKEKEEAERKRKEEEDRRKAQLEETRKREEARKQKEEETRRQEELRKKADEEARRKADEEKRQKEQEDARKLAEEQARQETERKAAAEREQEEARKKSEEEARKKEREEKERRDAQEQLQSEREQSKVLSSVLDTGKPTEKSLVVASDMEEYHLRPQETSSLSHEELKLNIRRRIEEMYRLIESYNSRFNSMPETSLKQYHEKVFGAFHQAYSECAIAYNANCHDQEELIKLEIKIKSLDSNFTLFETLLNRIFEITEDQNNGKEPRVITDVRWKRAADVQTTEVNTDANNLINSVEINGFHGLALSIANFIVKSLLALGIGVAGTVTGAYIGGVVGGIFGLSTVTFTGPAGLIVGASLGTWIGGAIGCAGGTAGGIYTSSKATFFKPLNTSLQTFAEKSKEYAQEIDAVRTAKVATAA
jgi:hypothetical protein